VAYRKLVFLEYHFKFLFNHTKIICHFSHSSSSSWPLEGGPQFAAGQVTRRSARDFRDKAVNDAAEVGVESRILVEFSMRAVRF